MSNVLFFKRVKDTVRVEMVNIACVLMITLLLFACAGGNKKQTLSQASDAGQVGAKADLETGETDDDQEIVCRHIKYTGSRFKHKVCNTKAQWAALDGKKREDTDEFLDDVNKTSRTAIPSASDGMGGSSSGMPR